MSKENNRLQNSRRKSGREERKHEKGKERIILPLYIKLSDDYPTVILTKEPAGWRGNGAG